MKDRWFSRTVRANAAALIVDERAQAVFEYALVGSVLAVAAIAMLASVQKGAAHTLASAQTSLTRESVAP